MSQIVLMYHGLYESDTDLQDAITTEDRPYAVARDTFRRQLAMIAEERRRMPDKEIVLTFDDGHISNRTMAMPDLQAAGMQGIFFITTGFMHERPHFCRADDVRALHEGGMIVGSHGRTHQFLDADMDEAQLREEFVRSRADLEQASGAAVCSLSFPGGRYCDKSLRLAREAGLRELHGSKPGINRTDDKGEGEPLKRVAIRHTTSDDEFLRMIRGERAYYAKISAVQTAKHVLRKTLGNRLYHGLYKSVASLR
ncbi:polysaccharide deacetylase family protein [Granulosicoccaceae sp. 1_MG-2023]|nr:polysaccharide deacetylase family protein [Granulosicoccaceae sp. 1_MG-2023]